jgi:hypothetical protein
MSDNFREFIVTLKDKKDLEQFYLDMENSGTSGNVPERAVECVSRRSISRNTHYKLTKEEVEKLKADPRVESITLRLKDMGVKASLHSQTGTWSRADTIDVDQKNWGLYRTTLVDNVPGWGSESGSSSQTSTINVTPSGKDVDIVVLDEMLYPSHSEFDSRVVQYDWFANHNIAVWPENPNTNYQYNFYSGGNNHATHVAGIIGGNTQGWARGANLYNFRHDTSDVNGAPGDYTPSQYVIDYIREWHNNKNTNPETGSTNPTVVNCSWGLGIGVNYTNTITGSGNSRFSEIFYRGSVVTPESIGRTPVDTGFSGVCNATTRLATLSNLVNGGNRLTTSGTATGACTSITLNLQGDVGMTDLGAPTSSSVDGVDVYDDAYWSVTIPFTVTYCGGDYTTCSVSTNSFVMFGGSASQGYTYIVGASSPPARKITISAGDRSCQRLLTKTTGTTPNREFTVRWEGHDAANGGLLGSPTTVWEITFYENTPTQIDLHIGNNASFRGEFTLADLETYGIVQTGFDAPYRDAAMDADITDAINDGIIFVGSAGNGGFKVDVAGGGDYNNYFVDNGEPFYYHRGATPSASHPNVICVGAFDSSSQENKSTVSNTGPRVDVYAPGKNIISSVYDSLGPNGGNTSGAVNDGSAILNTLTSVSRNAGNTATIFTSSPHGLTGDPISISCSDSTFNATMVSPIITGLQTFEYTNEGAELAEVAATGTITVGYFYQKYNGTSMSAAQVTGITALALETYPNMTSYDAKEYIVGHAQSNKMFTTGGGHTDYTSLQSGNNKILYYYKERADEGLAFPKLNWKLRPTTGSVYPRTRIRKTR